MTSDVTAKETSKHDVSNCNSYKLSHIGFYSSYTRKKFDLLSASIIRIKC